MKLILLQDVKSVGKKGDVINAKDGYARNFLLPGGLAVEATKENLNEVDQKKQSDQHKKQLELDAAQGLADSMKDKIVTVAVKAGQSGKVFGSVTNKEIASAISKQLGIQIDKKKILLDEPIKNIGKVEVKVKLHPKVTAKVTIQVEG